MSLQDFSGNIDEELRHVRKVVNERPLFLSFGGKAPHPLLFPLGDVKIAVGADAKPDGLSSFLSITTRALISPFGCVDSRSSARMLPVPEAPI